MGKLAQQLRVAAVQQCACASIHYRQHGPVRAPEDHVRHMVTAPEEERCGCEPINNGVKAEASGILAKFSLAGVRAAFHAEVPEEADAQRIEMFTARANELTLGNIEDVGDPIHGFLENQQ